MSDWWNRLAGLQQFFYGTGILFSAILVLQTVMMLFGVHHDLPHDAGGGGTATDTEGIHVLSIRTVVAFFVGFGWGGAAALSSGVSPALSVILATLCGAGFMFSVFGLMKMMYSMRYSGTLNYDTITGQVGSVYMAIPPAQTGNGQVEIMIQGRLQMLSACTKSAEKIPTHAKVKVIGTFDAQTVLVETITAKEGELK